MRERLNTVKLAEALQVLGDFDLPHGLLGGLWCKQQDVLLLTASITLHEHEADESLADAYAVAQETQSELRGDLE